jgi:SAM-dependent methyltransferase
VDAPNQGQIQQWNDPQRVHDWVDGQAQHDQMLAPYIDLLLEGAQLRSGDDVLDIGCGCGATSLAAARVVAPGHVVGADISAGMLARARESAAAAGIDNVTFQQADAQVGAFDRTFDAALSRFGVMFFDDTVAAFANIRRAMRPGGRLAFVCWQPLAANEWQTLPSAAIAEHVPAPAALPSGPGMFSLAAPDEATRLLTTAGWSDATAADVHVPMYIGGCGTLDEAVAFVRTSSLAQAMLKGVDADTEARAMTAVRAALEPRHDGTGVLLDAAVWVVTARA